MHAKVQGVSVPKKQQPQSAEQAPQKQAIQIIDPRWILKAVGITILVAFLCAYATLCAQYSIGAWQLILHPSPQVTVLDTQKLRLPSEEVHFDSDEVGNLHLAGIWVPGVQGERHSGTTLLCATDADGRFDDVGLLQAAHQLGANLFLFDYRGFGKSAPARPHEQTMNTDAEAALSYLQSIRKLPLSTIFACGQGVGASIATTLAVHHGAIPALIVADADPAIFDHLMADKRSTLVPARLLTHDRFDVASGLAGVAVPKLLIQTKNIPAGQRDAYTKAAMPKHIVDLSNTPSMDVALRDALSRFLDEYLPAQPLQLTPQLPSTK